MKYKILYHMMKEVKASLTGGTPEEDAVRAELPEGGVAALTVNDIDRISGFLRRIPSGDLLQDLVWRRYQLLEEEEEAVKAELPEGGVAALTVNDIDRISGFLKRIPHGDLRMELRRRYSQLRDEAVRAEQLQEDAVRAELPEGGVEALTVNDIDRISGFLRRIPYGDLFRELSRRLYQLQEEAVRAELPEGGVEALTVNDIDRISGFLRRISYGDLFRDLVWRRYQLRSEPQAVARSLPPDSPAETDESLYCKICLEKKADVIIQPCKHLICGQDYRTIKEGDGTCPMCRGPIQGWKQLTEEMKQEDFYHSGGGLKCIR
jgi:hypothetical protein